MPSDQYQGLVNLLSSRPQATALPEVDQMRAGMEGLSRFMPLPDWAAAEPVDAGGVPCEWVTASDTVEGRAILYFHGGGYMMGSIGTHRAMCAYLSRAAKARVLVADYRLAPEHPHPAAVEDALTTYRWLLAQGVLERRLAVAGDSAGGGLTFALLVALRDSGVPLPAAAAVMSPWVDMEGSGESAATKKDVDPLISPEFIRRSAAWYLGGKDPRTPLASPLYADLSGFPPTLIQVGEREVLLDDARRIAERAEQAGVDVTLDVWPEMIHVWQMFAGAGIPEAQEGIEKLGGFLAAKLEA